MTISQTNNQAECLEIVAACGLGNIKPIPPNPICDCLWPMGGGSYLIVRYNRGQYSMWLLQDATESQAWGAFTSQSAAVFKLATSAHSSVKTDTRRT